MGTKNPSYPGQLDVAVKPSPALTTATESRFISNRSKVYTGITMSLFRMQDIGQIGRYVHAHDTLNYRKGTNEMHALRLDVLANALLRYPRQPQISQRPVVSR